MDGVCWEGIGGVFCVCINAVCYHVIVNVCDVFGIVWWFIWEFFLCVSFRDMLCYLMFYLIYDAQEDYQLELLYEVSCILSSK